MCVCACMRVCVRVCVCVHVRVCCEESFPAWAVCVHSMCLASSRRVCSVLPPEQWKIQLRVCSKLISPNSTFLKSGLPARIQRCHYLIVLLFLGCEQACTCMCMRRERAMLSNYPACMRSKGLRNCVVCLSVCLSVCL